MGMDHHGEEPLSSELLSTLRELEHAKRFIGQATGTARREFPGGRMGAEDDGCLSYAIATDDRHKTIVIRFPKQVAWIGLDVQAAEELRDQLTERLLALRGVNA